MKWFQTDSDAPNDPKLKTIIRRGVEPNRGQAAAGAIFLLWCYVANHGKGEPGLGIRADGRPLALDEMAGETMFDDIDQLRDFIDYAADRGHVHPEVWKQKGVVFLPAMWERVSAYYRSKARKMDYQTAQEVVDAVLAGSAQGGPARPVKALPTNKPTRQTKPTDQGKSVGPAGQDLLGDTGPDQVDALVKLWNDERKPGPAIRGVPASRRRAMQQRLREHPNLDDWRRVVRYLNGQKWCNAPGTGDHPNFRMDIDTLLKPGKFQTALERSMVERPAATDGTVGRDAARGRTGAKPGVFADALKGGDDETGG